MKLDIVIPTYHRINKLTNCIKSIINSKKDYNVNVYIYFSDLNELKGFVNSNKYNWLSCKMFEPYRVPDFWNSHLKTMTADAMMYITDDTLFYENTIDEIFKELTDLDILIGVKQDNLPENQALDSAFGIIGTKFADRFQDRQVWCLDYYRFYADKELGEFAKSINKFKYCDNIKITHLHPSVDKNQLDATHYRVREFLPADRLIYQLRKSNNYLWGRDYKLIKER